MASTIMGKSFPFFPISFGSHLSKDPSRHSSIIFLFYTIVSATPGSIGGAICAGSLAACAP